MPNELTLNQFALIVGTIFGLIFGIALLIVAYRKDKLKLGVIGFVLTVAAGVPLSMLGILPVFGIFLWLILRKPKVDEKIDENLQNSDEKPE